MRNYHEYYKECIGASDGATLIMVGGNVENSERAQYLYFHEDGGYWAYIVDDGAEIGRHYTKVAEFERFLKIYDDEGLTHIYEAPKIMVYRAGDFGCIIQLIGRKKKGQKTLDKESLFDYQTKFENIDEFVKSEDIDYAEIKTAIEKRVKQLEQAHCKSAKMDNARKALEIVSNYLKAENF